MWPACRPVPILLLSLGAVVAAPSSLAGQVLRTSRGWQEATVGSELETYLRVLQLAGESPLYPWSVRAFSPREIDRLAPQDTLHPWAARLAASGAESPRALRLAILRPQLRLIYNTGFPWARTDGVVWAGRGLTSAIEAGVQARLGPLSLTLDPILFDARNASFSLLANGLQGQGRYATGLDTGNIDLPQRFGDRPYARLDPGQSTMSLDLVGVSVGVSTANQFWGPGLSQALILGNAGPGFLHIFAGSSKPVNLWIGHLHGRVEIGRLDQSAYSPMPADSSKRLMAGFVATFVPRWTPGLELGMTRFYHRLWPAGGFSLSAFKIPFQGLFFSSAKVAEKYDPANPNYTPENQILSIFARWAFPGSGFEVYGEFARDDRNRDVRDLISEPDQQSAFSLGLVKLLHTSATNYTVLRAEYVNARVTYIANLRIQPPLYENRIIHQGHTNRGIVLGSSLAALGGVGSIIGLDFYRPDGRWTVELTRDAHQQPLQVAGVQGGTFDVPNALRVERLLLRLGWDFTAAGTAVYELNRNFGRDAFNLRLDLGARVGLKGWP